MLLMPSAGMLWPEPRPVAIAGRTRAVLELRVKDIAAIEYAFAEFAEHPHRGIEDTVEAMRNKGALSREELLEHTFTMIEVAEWPPKAGSDAFAEVLATAEGSAAFLWVVLSRTDRDLAPEEAATIAEDASDAEIEAVSRVAWGYQGWEAISGGGGESGRGFRWGEIASQFARTRHFTYAQVGEMFLSQVLNELAAGQARDFSLRPWVPA